MARIGDDAKNSMKLDTCITDGGITHIHQKLGEVGKSGAGITD